MLGRLRLLNANLKIGARINGGFAAILVLLLVVAATALIGLAMIQASFEDYSRISTNVATVQQSLAVFEGMRRTVRRYLTTGDEADRNQGREEGDEAKRDIDHYAAAAVTGHNKQLAVQISEQLATYLASTDQLTKLLPARNEMISGRLRGKAVELRGKLTAIFDGASKDGDAPVLALAGVALQTQLLMQIDTLRYVLHSDQKEADAFDDETRKLADIVARLNDIDKSADRHDLLRGLAAPLTAYQDDFHETVKLTKEIIRIGDQDLNKAANGIADLYRTLLTGQRQTMAQIKDDSDRALRLTVIGCVVATILTLLLGWFIARFIAQGIARPVIALSDTMKALTAGRLDTEVPGADRGDEVGDMAKAVLFFRDGAIEKKAMETEALATAAVNLRVRSALDASNSNMMIADSDCKIVYMNPGMTAMFRAAESEIRKVLPEFDAANLIGQSVDVFHQDRTQVRAVLAGLAKPHEMQISIAGEYFHLIVVPVVDAAGHRSGFVVEWRNRTAEVGIEQEVDRVVSAAVAGDLTQRITLDDKQGFMLKLSKAMNELSELRLKFIAQMGEAAREVSNAAAEISASSTDLSQRTEEQAASLEQTSASMEEISATVKKNAENAQRASQLTSTSRDIADRGGGVVADAVKAMARIEESSRKIADIIGVIDEIARQTNLLALNAAVEAARAGDAGRGFAVVASEVRSLAQRSSQAAKDIKDLITNSSSQVKDGVELVNQAGASLNEIVDSIKQVVEIVVDITTASGEQAEGLGQINMAMAQMDEVTQQNSALVEENAASAKALEQQAVTMHGLLAGFKLDAATTASASVAPRREAATAVAGRVAATATRTAAPSRPMASEGSAKAPGKPAAKPAPTAPIDERRGPVGRMQAMVASAFKQQEPDWKEF